MARKKAWIYQVASQVAKHGAENAAWNVGWIDPDGKRKTKSCGPGRKGKADAKALADKTHSQIVTGTYAERSKATWDDFMDRYESSVLAGMDPRSREAAQISLNVFQRISKPGRLSGIDTEVIDGFIAKRRVENIAKSKDSPVRHPSPATINRDLRYIRAALLKAKKWKDLKDVPDIQFLKVPEKLARYCTPEHFDAIYAACDHAKFPVDVPNVTPADWWRAVLVFAQMTGWRIGQIMALRWEDVDLDKGTALSRAEDNKGDRDVLAELHPLIVEHLRKIAGSFDTHLFPWNHDRRTLWVQFGKIQAKAVVRDAEGNEKPLPKGGKRGWYGFHDLRRSFATMNAGDMNLFELQERMQHRDLATTKLYVNMAAKLNPTVGRLFVPESLKPKIG